MRTGRFWFGAWLALVVACGARTGLLVGEPDDGGVDAGRDVRRDVLSDVSDALPPIDVTIPPDVDLRDCPDADLQLIYVISSDYDLLSFNPATNSFKQIGTINCPGAGSATPFSMAVDKTGVAMVVFNDGRLFRVSTATAACTATPFQVNQDGFGTFGMGYATDGPGAPTETLYDAGDAINPVQRLAFVDSSFTVHTIGAFTPMIQAAELTGSGAGDLFAFYRRGSQTFVGQIDKSDARVIGESPLPGVSMGQGWAFAFYGGDFYLFTAPTGETEVTRFRPSDGSIDVVATTNVVIVGAGVSTCAPVK